MHESQGELRARDLLRSKQITPPPTVGHATVDRLLARKYRRPAGCSARLFKGMSTEDPFAVPEGEQEPEKEVRTVAAADRFQRIDKHEQAKAKKPGVPVKDENKVPSWVIKLRELKEREASAPKASPKAAKDVKTVHTPAFGTADSPLDRTPPKQTADEPAASRTGRMGARPRAHMPRVSPSEVAERPTLESGALDRTPPKVGPAQGGTTRSVRRGKPVVTTEDDGIDRRPPVIEHVVTNHRGEPLTAHRNRSKVVQGGAPPGGMPEVEPPEHVRGRTRKVVQGGSPPGGMPDVRAPDPVQVRSRKVVVGGEPPGGFPPGTKPEPVPPPSSAGGPDDLFGGGNEGRAKLGRRAKTTEPTEATDAPSEAELARRRPPRVAVPGKEAVNLPDPEPIVEAAAPEVETPPVRRTAGSGGLDDLFGGPTEGRAKIGRRAKQPAEELPEQPSAEELERRRPPRVAVPGKEAVNLPDPAPVAESAAAPAAAAPAAEAPAEPPPRRVASSGGLDDLFGAPMEGRARMARAKPAEAPAEQPGQPSAEELERRRPPRLAVPGKTALNLPEPEAAQPTAASAPPKAPQETAAARERAEAAQKAARLEAAKEAVKAKALAAEKAAAAAAAEKANKQRALAERAAAERRAATQQAAEQAALAQKAAAAQRSAAAQKAANNLALAQKAAEARRAASGPTPTQAPTPEPKAPTRPTPASHRVTPSGPPAGLPPPPSAEVDNAAQQRALAEKAAEAQRAARATVEPPAAAPRRTAGSGSLDDLFGAPPEGRTRLGRRAKVSTTVESGGDGPKETIDRTPPRIEDVDPSKLTK